MAGINFRFYSFKDNIIDRVLTDIPCKNTIFILPTENSKRFAIREFRKKWTFSDTRFLTMEELKRTLFIADKPLLKNEKRAIAFYTALSEDDKSYFRISNYFQAHELSSNFFDLWSQFAEELVVENIDPHAFDSELLDWQINTYDRLLQIKRRYRKLLLDNGFEDTIFLYGSSRLQLEAFHPSDHFVFVNQFYYTRLEKDIIDKITNQNKQVILTYQLPESLVDREKLKVREFTLKDLNEFTAEEIDIIQSDNDFAAFRSLLQTLRDTGIQQVVDNSFLRQDYFRFLSPSAFRIDASTNFTDSSIYRFFAAFSEMMNEIVWEPIGREYLLPLEPLLNAIAIPDFVFYFCVEDKSEQQQHSYNSLYRLIEDDYRYIDLEGKVLDSVDPGDSPLRRILGFIDFFLGIGAVSEFVDWIDSTDRGVTVSRLVHSSEHMYSDILDTFYSTLADFNSLESLDFVNNWRLYFGNDRGHATVSSGLLRLFVDMLRSRTVRLSLHPPETSRVEITDLPDTRNMTYSQVAVLNLIEGEIPSKRRIPFFFT
jgi:hypothetical protein